MNLMNDEINDLYIKSQRNQGLSAEQELDSYNMHLTTELKIDVLKLMVVDINEKELSKTTYKKHRIPTLIRKQVLEECIDFLEKYYAVERKKKND